MSKKDLLSEGLIKITIISGFGPKFAYPQDQITKVKVSRSNITKEFSEKEKTTILLNNLDFKTETILVNLNQNKIDTYNRINMDIKYALSLQDRASREKEIDSIIANKNYKNFLYRYKWILEYASKDITFDIAYDIFFNIELKQEGNAKVLR